MWGIIPAAGRGTRIQPLAFSKELLPVGSRFEEGVERPRAVSDYLVERMIIGGAKKICFVISPQKSDILEYYGSSRALPSGRADFCYVVQEEPAGLCDAIFRGLPFIDDAEVVRIGLPDTIWFPADAFRKLHDDCLSFLLFPVEHPEFFDAVLTDGSQSVEEIRVKQAEPGTNWIWGAFQMPGRVLQDLHQVWMERNRRDEYMGTLVNAWIERGGEARAVRAGESYADVGTLKGFHQAIRVLGADGTGW
jgi:glucose-1-phosphate thymidylyltransferase